MVKQGGAMHGMARQGRVRYCLVRLGASRQGVVWRGMVLYLKG